jgi:hypothetical protein
MLFEFNADKKKTKFTSTSRTSLYEDKIYLTIRLL